MSESTLTAEAHSFQIFWKWFDGKVLTLAQINSKRPASDPPDFEFDHSGKRLAMEHTRIENLGAAKLPPSHQSFIKNRIWKRLGELFQTSWVDMPPVTLSIQFVSCGDVRRSDEGAVAQGVLDLVRQRLVAGCVPSNALFHDRPPANQFLPW